MLRALARLSILALACTGGFTASVLIAPSSGAVGSVEVLAYEGFDYPTGLALTGLNGGTGWLGAWAYPQGGDSPLAVGAALTYPDLTDAGGSATYRGVRSINCSARDLPRISNGVVYVQALMRVNGNLNNGAPTIRLVDSTLAATTGGLGNNNSGSPRNNNAWLMGSGLATPGLVDSGVDLNTNTVRLMMVRIDYAVQSTDFWVNPNMSTFDYGAPPTANGTANGFAPTFNQLGSCLRSGSFIDELKVLRYLPPVEEPGEERPAPVRQEIVRGRVPDCEDVDRPDLNWANVAGGSWTPSWAYWPNAGLGGDICGRWIVYVGSGVWRSTSGLP